MEVGVSIRRTGKTHSCAERRQNYGIVSERRVDAAFRSQRPVERIGAEVVESGKFVGGQRRNTMSNPYLRLDVRNLNTNNRLNLHPSSTYASNRARSLPGLPVSLT